MAKIALVVNKYWEVEPMISALVHPLLRPSKLKFPKVINSPKDNYNKMSEPRAVFSFADSGKEPLEIKVWCIQDLMYLGVPFDPKKHSNSSSQEKYRVLTDLLDEESPDLVIAAGTASYPSQTSYNGSVIVGGNFFAHSREPENPKSKFTHNDIGKLIESNVNEDVFRLIDFDFKNLTESKFLKTPRNPCPSPVCIASRAYTAVSAVNVTDFIEYNWVDEAAVEHYRKTGSKYPVNSVETTHAVIRLSSEKPAIFISAITDRFGCFDFEDIPLQCYTASFNMGIVLGQMFCSLNDFVAKGSKFEK